jgi:hypothetical protein
MQNIQDVQNSKKIVSKQESLEVLSGVDSEFDAEQDTNCELDVNDDENQEISMKTFENQVQDDDLDVIFKEFGIQDVNDGLTNCQLGENFCGNLTRKMKEQHVIHDPVSSEDSALIQKTSNFSEQSYNFVESDHQQPLKNDSTDVVKVILNLDRQMENHEPQWDELEKVEVMHFNKFPLAMKSCISHYKLDLKQAAVFNVICSTFMLAYLEEPSLKKH